MALNEMGKPTSTEVINRYLMFINWDVTIGIQSRERRYLLSFCLNVRLKFKHFYY